MLRPISVFIFVCITLIDISMGYSCVEHKEILYTNTEGQNETFVSCILKRLNVHSLNMNKFDLQFNKAVIANITNLTVFSFENNTDEKNFVVKIKIKNSKLRMLPRKLFKNAPKLETLEMPFVGLTLLPAKSFESAENLRELDLHGNKLKRLPYFCFNGASNLKTLDLSSNSISNIHEKAFATLAKLEQLVLDNNDISKLHDEIFHPLEGLKYLHLDRNQITIIPSTMFIKSHSNLNKIFLNENRIEEISPYAFDELVALRYLMLTGNGCVNRDFVNHKVARNVGIKFELRLCIKHFNKVIVDEVDFPSSRQLKDLLEKQIMCIYEKKQLDKELSKTVDEIIKFSDTIETTEAFVSL